MGEMAILSENGDDKIRWNIDSKKETGAAKKEFNKLKKDGYTFFYADIKGNQKGEIKDFDENAGLILAIMSTRKG